MSKNSGVRKRWINIMAVHQHEDTLPELCVQNHTVSYRIMGHTRDIKRLQVHPLSQQVC